MMAHLEILAFPGRSRRLRRGVLLAVVALALPVQALSQLADEALVAEEEIEEIRRYTVELIVFEYANSAMSGSEIFLPDEPLVDEELLLLLPRSFGDPGTIVDPDVPVAIDDAEFDEKDELGFLLPEQPEVEQVLEEVPSHILQTQLKVLDAEEHAMKDIYEKLVELDAYKPIMRAAWMQATFEKDQTLPIRLRRLGNAPLRLDGNVMLYLSRYLHFVVDLTIESEPERSGRQSNDDVRKYSSRRSYGGFGYDNEPETTKIKYTISEDRIFRNGELRYYDHPKFGVLARITRFEEEQPETDEMFLLPADVDVSETP
jgi:hypothetical protein